MKPHPFIFLIGSNAICALLLIALGAVIFDWLQGIPQNPLVIASLFALAIYSFRANQRVTAYKKFQGEWDAISGKQLKPRRKSQIVAGIFIWLISLYILFKTPRESDPLFYDLVLGVFFIPFTLWFCYLLLHNLPGLALNLFRRVNSRGHSPKDYIVSHCQSVPRSTAVAAQINRNLPSYCKSLLEQKQNPAGENK